MDLFEGKYGDILEMAYKYHAGCHKNEDKVEIPFSLFFAMNIEALRIFPCLQ